ncbi:hypothetical protein PPERSA_11244 [Pseudocohnilembus persalinus]|uniref:Uncharacterized protein n=1 Tax=Pseudocohnilembus persalinus TaxID=266149 RepID=A0A0V0QZG3_PSEPJ|nr:hypothetical protein PPERSA_11244 [Pseudocohnilembus persalinus]|eukprot:KRX07695.1 hypothetical protein PPERSA_11244 [Pseudocohnilembus persalinus]
MKQSKCLDASMLLTDSEQKKDELAIITGQKSVTQGKNADVWINFYEKIKEIRQYHKKHANVSVAPTTVDSIREQVFSPPNQAPDFTGEEGNGKYVDMDKYFQEYLNLNFIETN